MSGNSIKKKSVNRMKMGSNFFGIPECAEDAFVAALTVDVFLYLRSLFLYPVPS